MPTQFALDIAYGSNATPKTPGLAMAMAFGFAETDPTGANFAEQGQRPEVIPVGSSVFFNVFDTDAEDGGYLQSIEIVFNNDTCPFNNWINGMRTFPGDEVLPTTDNGKKSLNAGSAGCNVKGTEWMLGPYTASLPGKFECTVTVTLKQGTDSTVPPKRFQVDPELDVEGDSKLHP